MMMITSLTENEIDASVIVLVIVEFVSKASSWFC